MPIVLTIDHERKRIVGVATGVVTLDDMRAYMAERMQEGVYSYVQMVDARAATLLLPTDKSLFGQAQSARRDLKATEMPRTALVAKADTAMFGYLRQLAIQATLSVGAQIEVFAEVGEAEAWLAEPYHR